MMRASGSVQPRRGGCCIQAAATIGAFAFQDFGLELPRDRRGSHVDPGARSSGFFTEEGDHFVHHAPQTSRNRRSQFSPITFSIRDEGQPRRIMQSVSAGVSPIVRMPSGLTIAPKSVRRRA